MAAQCDDHVKRSALIVYSLLRRHLSCGFETFFRDVAGPGRADIAAMLDSQQALRMTHVQQIPILAAYLDSVESGEDWSLATFLHEFVDSIAQDVRKADRQYQESQFVDRVFNTPPPASASTFSPAQMHQPPQAVVYGAPAMSPPAFVTGSSLVSPPVQNFAPQPVNSGFSWPGLPMGQPGPRGAAGPNPQHPAPVTPGANGQTTENFPQFSFANPTSGAAVPAPSVALPTMADIPVAPPAVSEEKQFMDPLLGRPHTATQPAMKLGGLGLTPAPTPQLPPLESSEPPVNFDFNGTGEEPAEKLPMVAPVTLVPAPEWMRPGARVVYEHGDRSLLGVITDASGKHLKVMGDDGLVYNNVAHQYVKLGQGPLKFEMVLQHEVWCDLLRYGQTAALDPKFSVGELVGQVCAFETASVRDGALAYLMLDVVNGHKQAGVEALCLNLRLEVCPDGNPSKVEVVACQYLTFPDPTTAESLTEALQELRLELDGTPYILMLKGPAVTPEASNKKTVKTGETAKAPKKKAAKKSAK